MIMKSSSFESPKPYLLALDLKQYSSTLKIGQDVLKIANLLHKQGGDNSQAHTTVKLNGYFSDLPHHHQ